MQSGIFGPHRIRCGGIWLSTPASITGSPAAPHTGRALAVSPIFFLNDFGVKGDESNGWIALQREPSPNFTVGFYAPTLQPLCRSYSDELNKSRSRCRACRP